MLTPEHPPDLHTPHRVRNQIQPMQQGAPCQAWHSSQDAANGTTAQKIPQPGPTSSHHHKTDQSVEDQLCTQAGKLCRRASRHTGIHSTCGAAGSLKELHCLLPKHTKQIHFSLASGQVQKMVFYLNLCKFLSESLIITDFIWCIIQRNLVFLPTLQTPHKLYFSN